MFGDKARKAIQREGTPVQGFHWGEDVFELADGQVVHDAEARGRALPGAHVTVRVHPSHPGTGFLETVQASHHLSHGTSGSATVLEAAPGPFGLQRLELDVLLSDGTRRDGTGPRP